MSFDKLDVLNREQFVDRLINLMDNLSDNEISVSFAIDGVWGSGKSFVLDMFEDRLSVKQSEDTMHEKYYIIRYNCWKYDYYDEPLVAMVATILDAIDNNQNILCGENGSRIKGVLKAIGATFLTIAGNKLNDMAGVDIMAAFELVKNGLDDGKNDFKESHSYDVYFAFNEALHSLQKILSELSEEYTIVFLVDELDRCLPEYATKVLERLHHLIEDTKNIIIEAAVFDGVKIRCTSKKILRSEASNRFEKGLDPNRTYMAIERACALLEKYADAKIAKGTVVYDNADKEEKKVDVAFEDINNLLGIVVQIHLKLFLLN